MPTRKVAPKFERHFSGPYNAGLRSKIRSVVKAAGTQAQAAQAVRGLATWVALTAEGRATLELVARDYAAVAIPPIPVQYNEAHLAADIVERMDGEDLSVVVVPTDTPIPLTKVRFTTRNGDVLEATIVRVQWAEVVK